MSTTPTARRRPPQEFKLPDGRKVIVASADTINAIQEQYKTSGEPAEIVLRGSSEHSKFLQQAREHHEGRRAQLKQQHGAAFDEWEDVQQQLNSVSLQLSRMSSHTSGLHGNYGKFGYDSGIRTYDEINEDDGEQTVKEGHVDSESRNSDDEPLEGYRQVSTIKIAKRPVVRQWFHRQVLWRGSEQTEIMAVELFLDLLYVGIIHSNGEHMSEEPNGEELLRFSITFIMSWKIWTDTTLALSYFETDDVFTRLEILFEIACLLAFTTNMTNIFVEDASQNTYTQLIAYYLAARLLYAVHYIGVAYLVPMIRGAMVTSIISVLVPSALWIGSIYVEMPDRLALIWLAIVLDMYGHGVFIGLFRYGRSVGPDTAFRKKLNRFFEFFPAMNIEHKVERMNAFVSLVLGYSVVGILFQSNGGYSVNAILGKAVIGLVQSFLFNWLYFDVDGSTIKTHAIRHSANGAILWQFAHLPFVMGYIVATSALSTLVLATDVPNAERDQLRSPYFELSEAHFGIGVRYFYCHGLAIALLSMGLISLSHRHRKPSTIRLAKPWRLANRVLACIVMFFLPLAHKLRSLDLVSITLGLTVWVLAVELWGKACKNESFFADKKDRSKIHAMAKAIRRDEENRGGEADNPNPGQETANRMKPDHSDQCCF